MCHVIIIIPFPSVTPNIALQASCPPPPVTFAHQRTQFNATE